MTKEIRMTEVNNQTGIEARSLEKDSEFGFRHAFGIRPASFGFESMLRDDVVRGLHDQPKTLPCKYFYDTNGSRLFERICGLEEYYLTRTERGILERNVQEICDLYGANALLVELGSGSSAKTRLLLDRLEGAAAYVPIDIASDQLESAAAQLRLEYPHLEVLPLRADYHSPLEIPRASRPPTRTVIFFPGSTIGNFEPPQAEEFLRALNSILAPGDA